MRVNISLSVNLEDVPLRVSTIMAENYDKLKRASQFIGDSSNNLLIEDDVDQSLKDIRSAQKMIHDVSHSLDDMKQILVGYQKINLDLENADDDQLSLPLGHDNSSENI